MENAVKILWADDEIDLLKAHVLFLEKKGFDVTIVSNGYDAIEELENNSDFDVVFLDESMPGITGLETLTKIKERSPHIPVVMITKNEAENVMEEALGSQISDYRIGEYFCIPLPTQITRCYIRIHQRLKECFANGTCLFVFPEIIQHHQSG